MLFTATIFFIVFLICYLRPHYGLVVLLNINLIRNLINIDIVNPCLKCTSENDVVLGALLPILGFFIIIYRISFSKKVVYSFDFFDYFISATLLLLIYTSAVSNHIYESFEYTLRYIFLCIPFFVITKLYFLNSKNFENLLYKILEFSMNFALVFGLIAVVVVLVSGYEEEYAEYGVIMRLTIQGVHPIPFAQSIGLGLISSLFLILRNIKKQIKSNLLFFKTALLTIILLYTNTRGVIISFVISMFFVLVFSMKKPTISKKIISVFLITTALLSSVVLFLLDFESLFGRFYSDESALISVFLRFVSIEDSMDIFINNLFTGIGPVGFSYISDLPYPHNFILDYLVFFGIFGLIAALSFIIFSIDILRVTNAYKENNYLFVILFSIFIFYAAETQVSFTLWMHKGMYLALGLFMANYSIHKRR